MSLILSDLPPPPIQIGITAGFVRPGIEVELGGDGPRAGAQAWVPVYGSGWAQTAWAGYGWRIGPAEQLGVVAGATHYVQAVGCFDVCAPTPEYGSFIGLSYLLREDRLWLRLTPHYYLPLGGSSAYPTLGLSGVPWAEVGFALTPRCDVSFRLGETLIKIGYRL